MRRDDQNQDQGQGDWRIESGQSVQQVNVYVCRAIYSWGRKESDTHIYIYIHLTDFNANNVVLIISWLLSSNCLDIIPRTSLESNS